MTTPTRGPVIDLTLSDICTFQNVDCTDIQNNDILVWDSTALDGAGAFIPLSVFAPPVVCGGSGIWTENTLFTTDTGLPWNRVVAISGDTFVTGNGNADGNAAFTHGEVQVYRYDGATWALEQNIFAGGGGAVTVPGNFGSGVGLSSDTNNLIISNSGVSTTAIEVYLRTGSAWALTNTLTISNVTTNNDMVDSSLSLSNDDNTFAIGTPRVSGSFSNEGQVAIFTKTGGTWSEQTIITAPAPTTNGQFGSEVYIKDNDLLINEAGKNEVHHYTWSGSIWNLSQTISGISTNFAPNQIDINDNYLALGSTGSNEVHIFIRENMGSPWIIQQIISGSGGFGTSVAFHNGVLPQLYIGANSNTIGTSTRRGTVSVWNRTGTTWSETQIFQGSAANPDSGFGWGIAVDCSNLAIIDQRNDAYIYTD